MTIGRIELENFRPFVQLDLGNLPSVVGIWGPNGCGKSALLQAIVVVKALAKSGYSASPPSALNSEGLLLGDWDSVYNKGVSPGKRLSIILSSKDGVNIARFIRTDREVTLDVPNALELENVRYFPPRRTVTSRSAQLDEFSPESLSLSPNRVHAYLHWFLHNKIYEKQRTGQPNELDEVNRWIEGFGLGSLSDRAQPGPRVEVVGQFTDRLTTYLSAVVDGGYGGNSMLPILLEAYSFRDGYLLVEEPEMSLHPGAQSDLFDFFIEMAKSRGHQVLFTSHSEYLLRRFARYHRDGKSEPAVGCFVGYKDAAGSHIEQRDLGGLAKRLEKSQDLLPELHRR